MSRTIPTTLALAFLATACSGSGGTTMQAGKWEMTTEVIDVKMANMPAGVTIPKTPPQKSTSCMTADQAKIGPGDAMKSTPDCTVGKNEYGGGKIALEMSCKTSAGAMTTKINGTYSATEMTMDSEASTTGANAMTSKARITAKRIGDCDK
jgi:hypothetical protein